MLAVANPSPEENSDKLTTRAAGFGIVKFNKKTRQITVECWPRNVDVVDSGAEQYPGWPATIGQEDNYARKATAYLPTIEVSGMTNPVVQVIDESNNEIVYTLRITGSLYRPKVFKDGSYTIRVGQQETGQVKTISGVRSLPPDKSQTLKIAL